MSMRWDVQPRRGGGGQDRDRRFIVVAGLFVLPLVLAVLRLGYLQVGRHGFYSLYASDQHDLERRLVAKRGTVSLQDPHDGTLYPVAANELAWQVYADPRSMKDRVAAARAIAPILGMDEADVIGILTRRPDSAYAPLAKRVGADVVDKIRAANIEGVGFVQMTRRIYPEKGIGGHLIGFASGDEANGLKGRYGIESSLDDLLTGTPGHLVAEKDAGGRRLVFGDMALEEAEDGADVVLTIDRNIQYRACQLIGQAVARHQADGGSIVVMEPNSGAVMAMCSVPDFDPSEYGKTKDISTFNNPVTFSPYEPGSIFKAVTVAAGLDAQKIEPKSTYNDTGEEKIDDFTIRNSDKKAHGIQTMTQALDESLNTGMIYIQRLLGKDRFRTYVKEFGFGEKTGVELRPDSKGDVTNLDRKGSIFAATASFGQGITTTPLQMVAAYGALANGGTLYRPHVVKEIRRSDGRVERTQPKPISQPISRRASRLVTGMLISVVENGHGKRAGVPGYWVAGKTGTAQVARTDGVVGYQKDATIGSFAGFAPAHDPKFVMLVKIDRPRDTAWAESSAAPVFGEMAKFLLQYLNIPPDRPVDAAKKASVAPLQLPDPPASASSTSSTR